MFFLWSFAFLTKVINFMIEVTFYLIDFQRFSKRESWSNLYVYFVIYALKIINLLKQNIQASFHCLPLPT